MEAVRGPPKKRKNAIVSYQSFIMPLEDNEAPAATASMSFPPPSQNLETTSTKKRKHAGLCSEASKSQSMEISSNKKGKHGNSKSAASKRSRSGSNQPDEPEGVKKGKGKRKKVVSKKTPKIQKLQLDCPAMGTRSKMVQPTSPAMSTRSKTRLSL